MSSTYKKIDYITQLQKDMILIQKGDFMMGGDSSEYDEEKPVHKVIMKADFYLCKYLVTNGLWKAVMGGYNEHSHFVGADLPVEKVSWEDIVGNKEKRIVGFLERLNSLREISNQNEIEGVEYRLPTEAQWEYAARGGMNKESHVYQYAGSNRLKEVAWYGVNSLRELKPVGKKTPNQLDLYDMSGNVYEWCEDVWHNNYEEAPNNGTAWLAGGDQTIRVVRGGSWNVDDVNDCRVSFRSGAYPGYRDSDLGFRLARY